MARIRIADLLNGGDESDRTKDAEESGRSDYEDGGAKRQRRCAQGRDKEMEEVNSSDSPRGVEGVGTGFVGGGDGVGDLKGVIGVAEGEEETCVLPNVYVESGAMGGFMDVREMVCERYEGEEDAEGKGWKAEGSLKERREKRRNAARAARLGKEGAGEEGAVEKRVAKALEKRMKNRAAVNKCRLKQRERIEQLEVERADLDRENGRMREVLRLVDGLVDGEADEWGGTQVGYGDVQGLVGCHARWSKEVTDDVE